MKRTTAFCTLLLLSCLTASAAVSFWFENWQPKPDAKQAAAYFMVPGANVTFTYATNRVIINATGGGGGTLQLNGDVTSPLSILPNVTATLANVGTAGTYTKTTFNAKGLETSGTAAILASADYANQGTTITLLHGNGAGNPSWSAVDLANDVTGNLGVTHLNSGLAAGATTFWCGNGTWATPTGGSAQTNISYTAVTNAPWQWGCNELTNWCNLTTNAFTPLWNYSIAQSNYLYGVSNSVNFLGLNGLTNYWKGPPIWLGGPVTITGAVNTAWLFLSNSVSSYVLAENGSITNSGNVKASGTLFGAQVVDSALSNTRMTFATTGGQLTDNAGLTFSSGARLMTVGDGTTSAQIKFNYLAAAGNGADFTGQQNSVDMLSFGFNNDATFGGTSAAASGRQIYFYNRVSSAFMGAINSASALIWGSTSVRWTLLAEAANASVQGLFLKADGTAGIGVTNLNAKLQVNATGINSLTNAFEVDTVYVPRAFTVTTNAAVYGKGVYFNQPTNNALAAALNLPTPMNAWAQLSAWTVGAGVSNFVPSTVTAATYYTITNWTYGVTNNWIFPLTRTNGVIQNVYAGWYKISFSVSASGSTGNEMEADVVTNGVTTDACAAHWTTAVGGKSACGSGVAILYLPVNSTVSLAIQNRDSTSIDMTHAQLNIGAP